MFRVENNVPDVYIEQSRDFQLFARLYDLVFQSSRFSIDSLNYSSDPIYCNEAILPLMSSKIGFFTKTNIYNDTYRKVLSIFPYVIRYKGSLDGIRYVLNLFERLYNTTIELNYIKEDDIVEVSFEMYIKDLSILKDIIEYLRPTGTIIRYSISTKSPDNVVKIDTDYKYDVYGPFNIYEEENYNSGVISIEADNTDTTGKTGSTIGFTQVVNVVTNADTEEII